MNMSLVLAFNQLQTGADSLSWYDWMPIWPANCCKRSKRSAASFEFKITNATSFMPVLRKNWTTTPRRVTCWKLNCQDAFTTASNVTLPVKSASGEWRASAEVPFELAVALVWFVRSTNHSVGGLQIWGLPSIVRKMSGNSRRSSIKQRRRIEQSNEHKSNMIRMNLDEFGLNTRRMRHQVVEHTERQIDGDAQRIMSTGTSQINIGSID